MHLFVPGVIFIGVAIFKAQHCQAFVAAAGAAIQRTVPELFTGDFDDKIAGCPGAGAEVKHLVPCAATAGTLEQVGAAQQIEVAFAQDQPVLDF